VAPEVLQGLGAPARRVGEPAGGTGAESGPTAAHRAAATTAGPAAAATPARPPAAAAAAGPAPTAPRPPASPAERPRRAHRAEDAEHGLVTEAQREDRDLGPTRDLEQMAEGDAADRVHPVRYEHHRLALRRPFRHALDGLESGVVGGGGARGLRPGEHARELLAVGREILEHVHLAVEADHHDLVLWLEQVDEVAQRLRHLGDLVLHAAAHVEGQGDAQG